MQNTTITFDSIANTTDHPYFDMTDPDHWDGMAKAMGKFFTENTGDMVSNNQLAFPIHQFCLPVAKVDRRKFWKFCGNVRYELVPMSNGDILMSMHFTPKVQRKYNVEQLLNEVRHIRDQGLDFSGMPIPDPVNECMTQVPELISQIACIEDNDTKDVEIRLSFMPKGTTINGHDMFGIDGEYELNRDKAPIRIGDLVEAQ